MAAPAIQTFVEQLAATKPGRNSDNFFDFTRPENFARRRNLELPIWTRKGLHIADGIPGSSTGTDSDSDVGSTGGT